jgi:hypothetical protein
MLIRSALCVVSLLLGGAAPGKYSMIGAGASSCGRWVADRSGQNLYDKVSDEQWVVGFLSGVGYESSGPDNPLNDIDADGVLAWIDNYCRAHPLDRISKAAGAFTFAHPN